MYPSLSKDAIQSLIFVCLSAPTASEKGYVLSIVRAEVLHLFNASSYILNLFNTTVLRVLYVTTEKCLCS